MLPDLTVIVGFAIILSANFIHAVPAINSASPTVQVSAKPVVRSPTDFSTIFSDILEEKTSSKPSTSSNSISKAAADVAPSAPNLFEFVYGPINAANNANGYMGFVFLDSFDANACALQCNARPFNNQSGPCIFFNIWIPVVNATATSPVCSFYNTVTDGSTATNTGQGDIQVTSSVGYSRINLLLDSSFQTFACTAADAGVPNSGCSTQLIPWAVFPGPNNGFTTNFIDIDLFPAHSGNTSAGLFLGPNDPDTFGAELTYTGQLNTIPEKTYLISVFYTLSSVPIPANANLKTPLFIIFLDDGSTVLEVFQTEPFQDNMFFNAVGTAFAEGSDSFTLQGGTGFPHMLFVDDIAMFELF